MHLGGGPKTVIPTKIPRLEVSGRVNSLRTWEFHPSKFRF